MAFAISGGIAGLGGALLAGVDSDRPARRSGSSRSSNSLDLVAMAVIGGLGTVVGPVLGPLWVVGLPGLLPRQRDSSRCSRRASACSSCCCTSRAASMQLVYGVRDVVVRAGPRRRLGRAPAGPPPRRSRTPRSARCRRGRRRWPTGPPPTTAPTSSWRPIWSPGTSRCASVATVAVDGASLEVAPGASRRADRDQRRRQVDAAQRHRRVRAGRRARCSSRGDRPHRPPGGGAGPAPASAARSRPPASSPT